jgi:hypothetical protein
MNARLAARIAESDRLQHLQSAEGQGLRAASVFWQPFRFSIDPERQARFELGFRDGRALMEVADAEVACETDPTTPDGGLRVGRDDDHAL